MPCAITSPTSASASTVASDAAATDGDEEIAFARTKRAHDRCHIASSSPGGVPLGAGMTRTFGDQVRRQCTAGNIDDTQARPAHAQFVQPRPARDQEIAWPYTLAGYGHDAACSDIAAGTANALARHGFRHDLRDRAGRINGVRIDHAVTVLGHG